MKHSVSQIGSSRNIAPPQYAIHPDQKTTDTAEFINKLQINWYDGINEQPNLDEGYEDWSQINCALKKTQWCRIYEDKKTDESFTNWLHWIDIYCGKSNSKYYSSSYFGKERD